MEEANKEDTAHNEIIQKDAPQLATLLKEMKEGLDAVRSKVQILTAKVKEDNYPTADGISYLEAKHLLLLNYCQSIVYYVLRKAKGLSIEGHPVVLILVEIRLFLEKVRPIDKKLHYQIDKLLKIAKGTEEKVVDVEKKPKASQNAEDDAILYRPNPDNMLKKPIDLIQDFDGKYRPPKFAPTTMDEDKMSKQEKMALRKDKLRDRKAKQNPFMKELIDDLEGRPEEIVETVGAESKELNRYLSKRKEMERQEEDHFIRAPLSKAEKRKEKHLKKSRNGLLGLTDGFEDEIGAFGFEDDDRPAGFKNSNSRGKKFNKNNKRKH
ncbi:Neuroguidin [Thalictrum thalictroides]|uniref:Neuroguidin n=1 Tax=Thalictrum thalictroides TaxID=46969 RepID=A0A7J6VZI7_THATH|nr:Neuroguidin [Thalictrum thalictroides]